MSDRERQIMHVFTYMWNLNKVNKQTKQNENRLTDTENYWMVARKGGCEINEGN